MSNTEQTVSELLPCPFCKAAMHIESNRDWHRVMGEHDEECVFLDPETMMVPATDEQRELLVRDWNRRKKSAAQHQGAPVGEVLDSLGTIQWANKPPVAQTKLYTHPDAGELAILLRQTQDKRRCADCSKVEPSVRVERAAFEKWFSGTGLAQAWGGSQALPDDYLKSRYGIGGAFYSGCCTQSKWEGWQARAALERKP